MKAFGPKTSDSSSEKALETAEEESATSFALSADDGREGKYADDASVEVAAAACEDGRPRSERDCKAS